jgi:hypothetical protein
MRRSSCRGHDGSPCSCSWVWKRVPVEGRVASLWRARKSRTTSRNAVQPERLDERRAVVGHEVVTEPPLRVVGAAVTAGVGHQHAVMARERGDVVGPHEVAGDQAAVEQDDRRACPVVLVMNPQPVAPHVIALHLIIHRRSLRDVCPRYWSDLGLRPAAARIGAVVGRGRAALPRVPGVGQHQHRAVVQWVEKLCLHTGRPAYGDEAEHPDRGRLHRRARASS